MWNVITMTAVYNYREKEREEERETTGSAHRYVTRVIMYLHMHQKSGSRGMQFLAFAYVRSTEQLARSAISPGGAILRSAYDSNCYDDPDPKEPSVDCLRR